MTTTTLESSRRQRLKSATHDIHARLDQQIMAFNPFADRERYTAFLRMQHGLHRDVEGLYAAPVLDALLPGLRERSRLALLEQDLRDLGAPSDPAQLPSPAFALQMAEVDIPWALGWLYTVEGSNIGAAFLLKAAARLELHAGFGARHLAPHAAGRAQNWRDFIEQLDGVVLPPEQERAVEAGAQAAFTAALAHAQRYLHAAG